MEILGSMDEGGGQAPVSQAAKGEHSSRSPARMAKRCCRYRSVGARTGAEAAALLKERGRFIPALRNYFFSQPCFIAASIADMSVSILAAVASMSLGALSSVYCSQ